MKHNKTVILKALVGSQAHGLADKDSDYDYRAVYVLPTSKILSLGFKYKGNDWVEGKEDNTAYEIGHFLKLAVICNPSILEVFKARPVYANEDGTKLRELFPYVWNPKGVFDAFVGYGLAQRKKMLNKKDSRPTKYAIAYLRTLYNLITLLTTKTFSLEIDSFKIKEALQAIKNGTVSCGLVIDSAEQLIGLAKIVLLRCNQEPNLEKVNEYLIDIRRRYW